MKARKFGYDVAYARTTVRAPTTCKPMPNVRLFWRESVWPPASCEADTTKESIKTRTESGKCFCIRVFFSSIKLRLIVMSTNLEYRERERHRKRESRRQASEAQREKGRQRSRARDKKTKETFFCWKNNMKIL